MTTAVHTLLTAKRLFPVYFSAFCNLSKTLPVYIREHIQSFSTIPGHEINKKKIIENHTGI
jgi:hypothetical protein